MSGPVMASLALHGLAVLVMAFTGAAPKPPKVKVYAVDIVSPPPNVAGEPVPEAMANQEPGPASPEPAPPAPTSPAPEPKPEPPAPEPDPAPPVPEKRAPREPEKAPEPKKAPERPTPPRPTPTPPRTTPTPNRPTTTPRTPAQPTPRPTTSRPGTTGQSGTGTDANRSRGEGTRTGPATGRNADAASPGGEGLTVNQRGVRCPSAGYCENIVRQVRRFFRAPEGAAGGSGNVCFRILRDGSVAEISTQRVRGGAAFRLALMEAAEQAGNRKAFGTLPSAFGGEELPVCVDISPSSAQ